MNIVIASAVRTPFGAFQGVLAPLKASRLGAAAVKEAVRQAGIENSDVDLLYMGNVLPAGMGQAPARQAAIYAGLDTKTPAVTLNKVCGSGLEAIIQAFRSIAVGDADIVVAGGMESMSNVPYLLPAARAGMRLGNSEVVDAMVHDGLWDAYNDKHMGACAEMCADKYNFSREDQDAFAVRSYKRAIEASREGYFDKEIVSVEVPGRRGAVTIVAEDEEPSKVNFEKLPSLRPVFKKDGSVTAANASSINDGAAALVLCSEEIAKAKGMPILARIDGYSGHAGEPEWFSTAPIGAMEALFSKLGAKASDIDFYEINEAFAVVTMAAMEAFKLSPNSVNVHGGAVALGHPIGASGARIIVTLVHALAQHDKTRGMASICIGGGEALAMALTRV